MKLITYSMNWLWKLSFISVAFWALVILAENWRKVINLETVYGWDGAEIMLALGPLAAWILVRWISIKE